MRILQELMKKTEALEKLPKTKETVMQIQLHHSLMAIIKARVHLLALVDAYQAFIDEVEDHNPHDLKELFSLMQIVRWESDEMAETVFDEIYDNAIKRGECKILSGPLNRESAKRFT